MNTSSQRILKIASLALLLVVQSCFAQTNSPPVLQTNWITAAPNFREVAGKLYNVDRSKLWSDLDMRCHQWNSNHTELCGDRVDGYYPSHIPRIGDHIVVKNFPTNPPPTQDSIANFGIAKQVLIGVRGRVPRRIS